MGWCRHFGLKSDCTMNQKRYIHAYPRRKWDHKIANSRLIQGICNMFWQNIDFSFIKKSIQEVLQPPIILAAKEQINSSIMMS